ncbi:MAG: mechanosensitive ion channel family protein [Methanomicrobiales archaeon]|nr:mechanosensitive ion channel family protein [Methanomicrobiales archaeon]
MILDTVIYRDVTLWNLLIVGIIMVIAAIITQIVQIYLKKGLCDRLPKNELLILLRVIRYTIIILAALSVLPLLSIDLTGLLVAGGFAGIVIGFASQSVVANLVSGVFLIVERPIKIGDQVLIEGVEGYVEDIHIFSTIVRSYDGVYVRLPNEKVFTNVISNYDVDVARRIVYRIGISYRDDIDHATRILRDVLASYPYALMNPPFELYVESLGDNAVNLTVLVWAPSTEFTIAQRELLGKIKVAFDLAGIEFPYPQRVVWYGREESERVLDQNKRPVQIEERENK